MKINTGKGSISLVVLLAIWSVSAIASLPGLAISPILGDLNKVFPKVTDLEIQMLTSLPSLLIIPSCCSRESSPKAATNSRFWSSDSRSSS